MRPHALRPNAKEIPKTPKKYLLATAAALAQVDHPIITNENTFSRFQREQSQKHAPYKPSAFLQEHN